MATFSSKKVGVYVGIGEHKGSGRINPGADSRQKLWRTAPVSRALVDFGCAAQIMLNNDENTA
jgi:hypothetical protein